MVERPQRSEMQQWKFNDPDTILNIGLKRIILPIPDVLYQQDIAAFELGSASLMQILLQRDKMIFHIQAVMGLARARPCFSYGLRLARTYDLTSRSFAPRQAT